MNTQEPDQFIMVALDAESDEEDESPTFHSDPGLLPSALEPIPSFRVILSLISPSFRLGVLWVVYRVQLPFPFQLLSLLFLSILSWSSQNILVRLCVYADATSLIDLVLGLFPAKRNTNQEKIKTHLGTVFSIFHVIASSICLCDAIDTVLASNTRFPIYHPLFSVVLSLTISWSVGYTASVASNKTLAFCNGLGLCSFVVACSIALTLHPNLPYHLQSVLFLRQAKDPQGINLAKDLCILALTLAQPSSLEHNFSGPAKRRGHSPKAFLILSLCSTVIAFGLLVLGVISFSTVDLTPFFARFALAICVVLQIPSLLRPIFGSSLPNASPLRAIRLGKNSFICIFSLSTLLFSWLYPLAPTTTFFIIALFTILSFHLLIPLLHILHHHISNPLSILIPHASHSPTTSTHRTGRHRRTRSGAMSIDSLPFNYLPQFLTFPTMAPTSPLEADVVLLSDVVSPLRDHVSLLQLKEEELQSRRFRQRLKWDVLVWMGLLPSGTVLTFFACRVLWEASTF